MKKRFTRILAAVALLVFMIPFTGWGQTRTEVVAYTLEPATGSNNSYTGNCDITIDDITWNLTGNSQQIPWRIGGKSISGVDRALYSKTAISDNISKIEVTHGAASSITVNSWTVIVSENADFSDPVSTLTPTFAANTTTTIIRPNDADWSNCYYKFVYNVTVSGSSNKFLEFTEAVFYKEGGSAPAVAAPTFSPAGGNYTSTQNVTISCETQGSTIYYTIDGSAPDNTSTQYNDAITVSETTTIKAIAYVGNDASSVASATYTIMQPLTTMQAIFNKATEVGSTATNVYVTFSNWVVVGKNSSNVYVTDGQYGLVIYQNNHGFNMGDKLSGTVACQVQLYNGGAELKGITASTQGLTVTQNATIEPYEISLTNITGEYIGSYVDLGQLEYNGSVFTDGENTIQPYNTFSVSGFNVNNLVSNKTYNVKGAYIVYGNNQTKEIAPRDLNDITEVVGTDPILSVDPTSLSFTYTQGATEVPSKDFTITGSNLTENVIVTLPAGNFTMYDGNDAITSSLTLIPNEGAINKTITVKMNAGLEQGSDYNGTITIEWEGDDNYTVALSGSVTEPVVDYATLPFEYDGNGTGDLPNGFTVSGLGTYNSSPAMKFDGTGDYAILKFNERPGILTFDIQGNSFSGSTFTVQTSEDGVTYTDLESYSNLTTTVQSEEFTNLGENVRYIKWIYTEKSSGNVALGNITLAEYVVLPLYTVSFCDNNSTLTELSYGAGVTLPSRDATGTYTFAGWSTTNVGEETITAPEIITGTYHPTTDIVLYPVYTRTVSGGSTMGWQLTSLADIDEGVYALLTNNEYAFNGTINSSGHGEATTSYFEFDANGVATSVPSGLLEITFEPVEDGGAVVGYKLHDLSNGRYLYATKAGSGGLAWHDTEDDYWKYDVLNYVDNLIYSKSYSGKYAHLRCYNNTFRTYENNSNNDIHLAKKVEVTSSTTYYTSLLSSYSLPITAYSGEKDHYYLISSPMVGGSNPMSVQNLLDNDYDLYRFDQTEADEWRNYKQGSFNLVSGQGYLYANSVGGEITFVGTPYSGNGTITLRKVEGAQFEGWNLIGNPFGNPASLGNTSYYRMNSETGAEIITGSGNIAAMEGVFVVAENDGDVVTFTEQTSKDSQLLNINVNNSVATIDRAIVRFDEGTQLPKFQLNPNNTKVYIPEGDQDYAVVRSANEGEMPVSFRASENGTYTISTNAENVEMNYLHLIDNMTGADVDLLATPSYTFEAKTSDYASRFRLVFKANGTNENNAETFAYFNGTNWTVSNVGDATLQVVDVTGRTVANQLINGNAELNLNQPAGVYVIRLVNGDNVKTQKVVVR